MSAPTLQDCIFNEFQLELVAAAVGDSPSPIAVRGGIGCGKSVGIAQAIHYIASTRPGSYQLVGMDSSPSLRSITLPNCKKVFGHIATWHDRDQMWTWPNGSIAELRYYGTSSTKDESENPWEGRDAHRVWVDEAQKLPPMVLIHATQRARQVAYDVAGRKHNAKVIICGRPSALDWWATACKAAGGMAIESMSYVNRANLTDDYFDNLKRTMTPLEYRSVVEGAPMPVKGRIYGEWRTDSWPAGNVLDGWEYDPCAPVTAAIDFGRTFPAVLFIQTREVERDGAPPISLDVVFAELQVDDLLTPELCERVSEIALPVDYDGHRTAPYRLDTVVCDPAGNTKNPQTGRSDIAIMRNDVDRADGLAGLGVHVRYTNDPVKRDIVAGITRVQRLICTADGTRRLVCTRELWDKGMAVGASERSFPKSIIGYSWKTAGKPGKGGAGQPDHAADALRYYAIAFRWVLDSHGVEFVQPVAQKPTRPRRQRRETYRERSRNR